MNLTRSARIAASILLCLLAGLISPAAGADNPVAYRIRPEQKLQIIKGIGFEIQSDSIDSGNQGLPENRVAVPHDLIPAERQRLYDEMLKGFRYCRLAGGLYWRGLDAERKQLQPRWPEQLEELREMMQIAGIEGLSFEYWSPAPYWKANHSYVATDSGDRYNVLRCFGPDFAKDPVYRGDVDRFLADFAQAVVADIKTLEAAGLKVSMWGLQNEPFVSGGGYSKCPYPKSEDYVRAYQKVAGAVRQHDARILLFADTDSGFPRKIAPGMKDPAVAALVDAYVVHTIGAPSENVVQVHARIQKELPPRPWFQNEYEYLQGGATPERCLNTVQHIMNSFQLAGNPTWFWLHALKPFKNAEASGYSLGFWKSLIDTNASPVVDSIPRWRDGPVLRELSDPFKSLEMILPVRGDERKPGTSYSFSVNQPVTLYLLVNRHGDYAPAGWEATELATRWGDQTDAVYRKRFNQGEVRIPPHTGQAAGKYGAPHAVFIEPSDARTFKAEIGMNVPIVIRSEYRALERAAAGMKPGSWIYNPHNWNAVGSFVKRLPWDSIALKVEESRDQPDARILAFQKPDGKRTIVVSNRTGGPQSFRIATGISGATWKGYRYTPQQAGETTLGLPMGTQAGEQLSPTLPHLSWEFWEEQ